MSQYQAVVEALCERNPIILGFCQDELVSSIRSIDVHADRLLSSMSALKPALQTKIRRWAITESSFRKELQDSIYIFGLSKEKLLKWPGCTEEERIYEYLSLRIANYGGYSVSHEVMTLFILTQLRPEIDLLED